MKKALTAFVMVFTVLAVSAQTDEGKSSDSKMIEVQKGIYMYQNKGGNIGLSIGNDGVFMIDDQFADIAEEILKDIKRVAKKKPQFIINTHHHGDHTGGNVTMAKEGAIIISHENVRKRLKEYMETAEVKVDEAIMPIITFTENMTFHYNGEEILVFHVHSAHTDGDAMVYFTKSNVLHSGDAFVQGRYPYIDAKGGGTVEGYIEGLESLSMMIDSQTKIIPGHGDIAAMKDVRELANLLNQALKKVSFHHLNGKTEAQILAMTDITAAYDAKGFGDGFIDREKFLKSIYADVIKKYDPRDMEEKREQYNEMKKKIEEQKKKTGDQKS